MAQEICEICGIRPATMRVAVMQDGQREELNICEYDYARLTRQQQRRSSPMESLFGDSPFGSDIFGDFMGRARDAMGDGETRGRRQAAPDDQRDASAGTHFVEDDQGLQLRFGNRGTVLGGGDLAGKLVGCHVKTEFLDDRLQHGLGLHQLRVGLDLG